MIKDGNQSLSIKTLLIVGGSITCFLIVMYLFAGGILWRGFSQLEQREANANVERIRNRVDSELNTISSKVRDWSAWDDAWKFMATRSKIWSAGNLDPNTTLPNLNADLLFYVTPTREIAAALQWDPIAGKPVAVDPEMTRLIVSESFHRIWSNPNDGKFEAKGIITVSGSSWLIASRSITKTDHSGAVRGTFFLAERLTPKRIQSMAKELRFSMSFKQSQGKKIRPILNYRADNIYATIPFQNYDGTPAFNIHVKFKREVMQQGRLTLLSMLALITLAAIGITILIQSQLNRRIIQRIDNLKRGAQRISATGSTKDLLIDDGQDEIRSLTTSINHMVIALEERSNEIKDIFQNVKFGFFMIDLRGIIQRGHTASSLEILKTTTIAERNAAEVLRFSPPEKMLFDLTLDQLIEDIIPDDVTLHQLPKCVKVEDRTISLDIALIRDEKGKPGRLLASIADATVLEQAELENHNNQTIITILRSKQAFASLLSDLSERQEILEEMADAEHTEQIKQELHTLNGNLRCFDLLKLSLEVMKLEDNATISRSDIRELFGAIRSWVDLHSGVTGVPWKNAENALTWDVTDTFLKQIVAYDPVVADLDIFKHWIVSEIRTKSLHLLVPPLENLAHAGAKKLGKHVDVKFIGSQLRVSPELFQIIADVIPHLLRNSVDHGIERQEERVAKQKSAVGKIQIEFDRANSKTLSIVISDDGQGINADLLAHKAIAAGILSETSLPNLSPSDRLKLIFQPKLSAKNEREEYSGRGYGMAAVRERIEFEAGGTIQVASQLGHGTTIQITLPLAQDQKFPQHLIAG